MDSGFLETNFDGLVGPTHHYAGHSHGNVASMTHALDLSHPRKAALQGISKMAALSRLGLSQAFIPPVRRPRLNELRKLGFTGTDSQMIESAFKASPKLLSAVYSASSMWTANAATVSPSLDTQDRRVHITAANLSSKYHRAVEAEATSSNLRAIFSGGEFVHHDPIHSFFGDEGAANHGRLSDSHGGDGIEVFVFGKSALNPDSFQRTVKFEARQSIEASHAVASHHGLDFSRVLIVQQSVEAVDAGVFHNDVVSVMNENVFFTHQKAFQDQSGVKKKLMAMWRGARPLHWVEVHESQVSLQDAVKSYLFNSQLVTLPTGEMALICPEECKTNQAVSIYLAQLLASGTPIKKVLYFDLRESMKNGGGPACLRLRVVMNDQERKGVNPSFWFTDAREKELSAWVTKYYRDSLKFDDLRDPKFFTEVQAAFDALEIILKTRIV